MNINKSDIKLNSLSEKIMCYKLTTFCACEKCSYDVNKSIKDNLIYSKYKTIVVTDLFNNAYIFFFH